MWEHVGGGHPTGVHWLPIVVWLVANVLFLWLTDKGDQDGFWTPIDYIESVIDRQGREGIEKFISALSYTVLESVSLYVAIGSFRGYYGSNLKASAMMLFWSPLAVFALLVGLFALWMANAVVSLAYWPLRDLRNFRKHDRGIHHPAD